MIYGNVQEVRTKELDEVRRILTNIKSIYRLNYLLRPCMQRKCRDSSINRRPIKQGKNRRIDRNKVVDNYRYIVLRENLHVGGQ